MHRVLTSLDLPDPRHSEANGSRPSTAVRNRFRRKYITTATVKAARKIAARYSEYTASTPLAR
ncbi:MAG: hypothetical protein ACR2OB_02215 [Solirubrobacteraceae bacterium]